MKKNTKWLIAAVLAIAIIVAAVVIFGGEQEDPQALQVNAETADVVNAEADTQADTQADTEAEPAQEEAEAEAEAATNATDVMITVNGAEILREDLDLIYNNLASTYEYYGYDTSDETFAAALQAYAVEYAVQLELMNQKAKENGLDQFTDEEKAALEKENAENWEEIVDLYVSYYGGLSDDATDDEKAAARVSVLSMLEGWGYTEAILLEDAMDSEVLSRVEALMVEGAEVTEAEVKALFDEYVAADEESYKDSIFMYEYMTQYYGQTSYYVPEGYRGITHILLEVDDELLEAYESLSATLEEQQEAEEAGETEEATDETTEEAEPETLVTQADVDAAYQAILDSVQPTIDEINQKLADGVAFADLIAEYGTDPGMQEEPYKSEGYSVHMDSILWDPAFVQAAFSVDNVGDVAAPVVGSYGVHIVQYTRDVPSGAVEFTEEVYNELYEEALSEKENALFNTAMEAWMAEANLVYSDEVQAIIDAANADEE